MRRLVPLLLSLACAPEGAPADPVGSPEGPEPEPVAPVVCISQAPRPAPRFTQEEVQGVLGAVPRYATDPSLLFDGTWTNWYRDPLQTGLAKLAVMRSTLEAFNLHDVHLEGELVGDPAEVDCPPDADRVRSIDGTCNDPYNPRMGAAGARIARNLPLDAVWPDEARVLDPNPREISRTVMTRRTLREATSLNLLAVAWVQLEVHDWFSHGDNDATDVWYVPLAEDDPLRTEVGLSSLAVLRTAPDPTRRADEEGVLPPTTVNEVTHWWDASQIYGSDPATAARLRTFEGGHLRLEGALLPAHADGASDAGFRRNWWVGLELLHTLFVREHNAIADHLAAAWPGQDDEWLYQHARLVNAALQAKIHTVEWTPAIIGHPTLEVAMNANWYGLNKYVDPPFPEGTDRILFGVVGNPRVAYNAPYAMTEEFVSVYRMHPLLPDELVLRDVGGAEQGRRALQGLRDAGARALYAEDPDLVVASFGQQHPGALTLDNYPAFLQALELPGGLVTDLATVDLIRDRERGVPRYNEVRRLLHLPPIGSFADLTPDVDLAARLGRVYGDDVEALDLLVGTLAEATRPDCFGFGETLFQVFILMASMRLGADRFYTDLYNAEVYTPEGLAWIEENTLATVIARHHPALAPALEGVTNAFLPW